MSKCSRRPKEFVSALREVPLTFHFGKNETMGRHNQCASSARSMMVALCTKSSHATIYAYSLISSLPYIFIFRSPLSYIYIYVSTHKQHRTKIEVCWLSFFFFSCESRVYQTVERVCHSHAKCDLFHYYLWEGYESVDAHNEYVFATSIHTHLQHLPLQLLTCMSIYMPVCET